jgi:hypothetical protein
MGAGPAPPELVAARGQALHGCLDHCLGLGVDDHRVLEQPSPVGQRLRQRPPLGCLVVLTLQFTDQPVLRHQPFP